MRGSYDPNFVLLSLLVAGLAAYTALTLAGRIAAQQDALRRRMWRLGGAAVLGTGIWSMHFIGMLAFSLPIRLGYDVDLTALSLAAAVAASYVALYVATGDRLQRRRLVGGGLVMGLGICAMHYTGMAAMRMSPAIEYDPGLFALSAAIAVGASITALCIVHRLRREAQRAIIAKRIGASAVMAVAITGMHYTGMAAATFAPGSVCLAAIGVDGPWLGMSIAAATVLVLAATITLSLQEQRLERSRREYAGSLRRLNRALVRMETVDPLTGLPNRATLTKQMKHALKRARQQGQHAAVLFMDLDGFKTINDSLGHSVGDALLRAFAERLRRSVRAHDLVARLGGDEFVVLLEGLHHPEDAGKVALAALGAMQRDLVVGESALLVTSSLGVAVYPQDGEDVETLLRNADIAMYAAKQAGRNTYRYYEPSMGDEVRRLLALQQGLHEALRHNQFYLVFQPKFTGQSRHLTGAEALLRWRHPELGQVEPAEFIPVAERSGMIVEIGLWVLEEACRHMAQWRQAGLPPLQVAINLSPKQLQLPDLAQTLAAVTRRAGLAPANFVLEITETVAMHDAERMAQAIHKLHGEGFEVAIDDFGTGYSSLAYLQQFRVQQLKIDRLFTHGLDAHGEEGVAIVKAIVALAHSLKMEVVAEGVETSSQADKLLQLACDQLQGFLLGQPLGAEQFRSLLNGQAAHAAGPVAELQPAPAV